MYRWCAYCQHFIGEAEPYADYRISHGVCASCEPTAEQYRPTPSGLRAQAIFAGLLQSGTAGRLDEAKELLRRAAGEGFRPVDLMLGVIQPALYRIGRLWETGEITVADEHRFTAFCQDALALLPEPPLSAPGAPSVLLVLADGNSHDLGTRMLCRIASEARVRCEAVFPGLPDESALELCRRQKPDLVGISASLAEQIPVADALARRIQVELGVPAVLGGGAFRRTNAPPAVRAPVLLTLDAFRGAVATLEAR